MPTAIAIIKKPKKKHIKKIVKPGILKRAQLISHWRLEVPKTRRKWQTNFKRSAFWPCVSRAGQALRNSREKETVQHY